MYSGHYGLVNVILRFYPDTSPWVFTFGVGFLDIAFGVLAFFGLEDFAVDTSAGTLGVVIHCSYSHSLVGSLLLSALYGLATGSRMAGFIASFSHWILDWFVHNHDLFLDPFSDIVVGGTRLWSKFPVGTSVAEFLFCLLLALASPSASNPRTIAANAFILLIHVVNLKIFPVLLGRILSMPYPQSNYWTCAIMLFTFIAPALILGQLFKTPLRRTALNHAINIQRQA
ncbi:hypothetical protein BX666DRAFT_1929690 [Dichotomocladium elegans]|nr:hypothetical protein BX666DRAFT_1929690 [Dichotomocladium elegans]